MSYSKSYQSVEAGRVREDESLAFFGQNKIATPARVTNFVSQGGQKQPTIVEEPNEFVGKAVDLSDAKSTKHNLGTGRPPTVNVS